MSSFNRSVRLRQGYGGTAFAGFARFRLVNPPLIADGLPSRKKKSGRESCRIFEGWWA